MTRPDRDYFTRNYNDTTVFPRGGRYVSGADQSYFGASTIAFTHAGTLRVRSYERLAY